jgi:hypothetical protein
VQGAKEKQLKVKGPVRMPTRRLVHTTRRAPSGNGVSTMSGGLAPCGFLNPRHGRNLSFFLSFFQRGELTNNMKTPA